MDVQATNQKIASLTKQKAFQAAHELFQSLVDEGKANQFTYSNILNAAIQCGNLSLAEEIYKKLRQDPHTKRFYYNVIIYTTMMKGYCQSLQLLKAMHLADEIVRFFQQSSSQPTSKTSQDPDYFKPNIRTFNTLLRGCIHVGNVSIAEDIFSNKMKLFKVLPDQSTYESIILLQCQNLQLDKVLPRVEQYGMTDKLKAYLYIARAACIMHDKKVSLKFIKNTEDELTKAKEALSSQQTYSSLVNNGEDDESDGAEGDKTFVPKKVVGGKRPWKSVSQESEVSVDTQRNLSLLLYRDHLYQEIESELQIMKTYLSSVVQAAVITSTSTNTSTNTSALDELITYCSYLLPLSTDILLLADHHKDSSDSNIYSAYSLASKNKGKPVSRDQKKKDKGKEKAEESAVSILSKYILFHLQEHYGIATLVKKCSKKTVAQLLSEHRCRQLEVASADSQLAEQILGFQNRLQDSFVETATATAAAAADDDDASESANVKLNMSGLFQRAGDNSGRKLKLEICAGAGEWACAQAAHDPEHNWMTLEIRQDRVYNTWTRMYMQKITNLRALSGDAKVVLPRFFPDNAVDIVFVNYPEPPQQHSDKEESEAKHLLSKEFFKEIYRILQPSGQLTILTDNLWYGKLLLRILADYYSQHFLCIKPPANKQQEDWKVNFEAHGMKLFEGEPGSLAGHSTQASSYFDRLWQRSSNSERYFITVRKVQTKLPINLQHIPTVRLASSLLMNTQGAVQNKKIVFTEDDTDPLPVKPKPTPKSADENDDDTDDSDDDDDEKASKKRKLTPDEAPAKPDSAEGKVSSTSTAAPISDNMQSKKPDKKQDKKSASSAAPNRNNAAGGLGKPSGSQEGKQGESESKKKRF